VRELGHLSVARNEPEKPGRWLHWIGCGQTEARGATWQVLDVEAWRVLPELEKGAMH
jgi:hypothetical protein